MSNFLAAMTEAAELRAGEAREAVATLETRAAAASPPVPLDLSGPGFDIIAEAKLASPSEGSLAEGGAERVVSLVTAYASSGAAAISVLTEETRFAGSMAHLEAAAAAVPVPVMRKDFLVDPAQVTESRAAGASGVLLIARILPGALLSEMTDLAIELGMFVLVEVFDRSDLVAAAEIFDRPVLVGVNSRDLTTLEVDRNRLNALAPHLPDHLPAVAESGMSTPDDVAHVAALGYRAALIGSSLVSDPDPAGKLERLIGAGRGDLPRSGS